MSRINGAVATNTGLILLSRPRIFICINVNASLRVVDEWCLVRARYRSNVASSDNSVLVIVCEGRDIVLVTNEVSVWEVAVGFDFPTRSFCFSVRHSKKI